MRSDDLHGELWGVLDQYGIGEYIDVVMDILDGEGALEGFDDE